MFREAAPHLGLSPADTTFVGPGLRQRRLVGRADHAAARGQDGRRLRRQRGDPQRRRDRRQRAPRPHRRRAARSPSSRGSRTIDADDLIAVPCDVFIPAALGGMIHEGNADRMQCKVIVEGANSPTTPAADEILARQGRLRHPRRDGQRRRRRRLLLRVGPEPPALPLGRARGQRQARHDHAPRLPRGVGALPRRRASTCATPHTWSGSSESSRRPDPGLHLEQIRRGLALRSRDTARAMSQENVEIVRRVYDAAASPGGRRSKSKSLGSPCSNQSSSSSGASRRNSGVSARACPLALARPHLLLARERPLAPRRPPARAPARRARSSSSRSSPAGSSLHRVERSSTGGSRPPSPQLGSPPGGRASPRPRLLFELTGARRSEAAAALGSAGAR